MNSKTNNNTNSNDPKMDNNPNNTDQNSQNPIGPNFGADPNNLNLQNQNVVTPYQPPVNDEENPYFSIAGIYDTNPLPPQNVQNVNQPKVDPNKKKFNFKEWWSKVYDFILKKWWLVLLVTIAIAATIVAGVMAFWASRPEAQPDYRNVVVQLSGPDTISKAYPEKWNLVIENRENVPLINIKVDFNFDRSFEFIRAINPSTINREGTKYVIPRLDSANSSGIRRVLIEFEGTSKGNIDEEIKLNGQIAYTPEPLERLRNSGRLSEKDAERIIPFNTVSTRTTAARIQILMNANPQTTQNNTAVNLDMTFKNTSERDLRDLRIRMFYPQGFSYTGSDLRETSFASSKKQPDESNYIWTINNFQRLSEQKLNVEGRVTGNNGAKLSFRVDMETKDRNSNDWQTIATASSEVTITAQPLKLEASIEGRENKIFGQGENLTFVLSYENQSNNTLKNVEINGSVQDPANLLDWSTVQFTGGTGNVDNRSVKWNQITQPQLANLGANAKGELRFVIRTKESGEFVRTFIEQSKYILVPQIKAQAQDVQPIESSGQTYKAKGDLTFEQKVEDVTPQESGQSNRKVSRVTWSLKSQQNQVNQVVIKTKSFLPTTSFGNIYSSVQPENRKTQFNYNPANGEITWNAGNIPSYSGISNPVVSVTFDIVVETPVDGSSAEISLFEKVGITGTDDFTAEVYTRENEGAKPATR
jgi:hypothetical protein